MAASRSFTLRLPVESIEWVEAEAARRSTPEKKVSKSEVVKGAVDAQRALRVPLVGSTENGPESASAPAETGPYSAALVLKQQTERLVVWLSGRTGLPKSLVRQRLKAGRVLVDGRDVRSVDAAPPFDGRVELDGEVY